MWYEILPSLAAVTTFLGVPTLVIAGVHKLVYGNLYQRDLNESFQRAMFLRDERLTGSGFKHHGLEKIPDEETSQ